MRAGWFHCFILINQLINYKTHAVQHAVLDAASADTRSFDFGAYNGASLKDIC
jgi:hypothetical protein